MNKAKEGYSKEIFYTKAFNKKEKFWKDLPYDPSSTYAIHVSKQKTGLFNGKKIYPKADIFLATGNVPYDELKKNDYLLDETEVSKYGLIPIQCSGISVKMPHSKYTISKLSAKTFYHLFDNNILGAGASIFCKNEWEINKNIKVFKGWQVLEKDFIDYFSVKLEKKSNAIDLNNLETLKEIKHYCNQEITQLIINSKTISDFIFRGIGCFNEPYTAYWIIEDDEIKPNGYIPFVITTGSGRSKGVFTVVVKPK